MKEVNGRNGLAHGRIAVDRLRREGELEGSGGLTDAIENHRQSGGDDHHAQ